MASKILGILLIVASFLIKLTPLIGIPFLGTILLISGLYILLDKKTTGVIMVILGGLYILGLWFSSIGLLLLGPLGLLLGASNLISGIVLVVLGLIFVLK